jgi:ribokinase
VHDVVVVGSANLDLVARAARLPAAGETVLGSDYAEHPGGKGLNQAVAAARSGASTAFVAALGDDDAGRALRHVISAAGIDDSTVATLGGVATGRAVIVVDDQAENQIVVVPGANAALERVTLPAARVMLCQLEIPLAVVAAALAQARAAGVTTVLNPAPATELPHELLELCDVLVPNEHEVELLGGAERLIDRGVGAVVVTRGAAGIDVVTTSGVTHQPPFEVTPIDTTGAGDACCGAIAARLAAGDDLRAAVRFGAAAGALATTVRGAVPSLPDADAVRSLLSGAAPPPPSHRG